MDQGKRRRFVPGRIGSFALESRLVLNAASVASSAAVLAAQTIQQNTPTLQGTFIQATVNKLHAAYQGFIAKYNSACRTAVKNLASGANPSDLLAGLKAYTTLEGGVLENQLNQVSRRLPGGIPYLYNSPSGTTPRDLYVPAALRLKAQADAMLATLTGPAVASIQDACSPAANTVMLQTYQNSRGAMGQYVRNSVTNGDFAVSGWTL